MSLYKTILLELLEPRKPRSILGSRKFRGSTGLMRKQQNLLPNSHTHNPNKGQSTDKAINSTHANKRIISNSEAFQIMKDYHMAQLQPGETKELTNTGVRLSYDGNKYYIEK